VTAVSLGKTRTTTEGSPPTGIRPIPRRTYVRMSEPSPLRRCGRCGESKPVSEFAWRRKERGQRHNMCRPCHAEYHREHYLANKQRYIDQAGRTKKRLRLERTLFLLRHFETHPCVDCGETDPVVLEFDHRGEKAFEVTAKLEQRKWESVLAEMAKCDVRCANCHRRRTAERRGALRWILTRDPGSSEDAV